jgi:P27 family predicted phage terminase small subunit
MPARRNLRAVPEGDPGHRGKRKLAGKLDVRKAKPVEPDWAALFPEGGDAETRDLLEATAHAEWSAVVPVLHGSGLLAGPLDVQALADYCVCVARIQQCERDVTVRGLVVKGREGTVVRNPSITSATQYRTQLRSLISSLGLSPAARDGMKQPEGHPGAINDPFSA